MSYTHSEVLQHSTPKAIEYSEMNPNKSVLKQTDDIGIEHKSQFRCWQHGQLIVDKTNLVSPTVLSAHLVGQGNSTLKTYDFGETFCLYTGEES